MWQPPPLPRTAEATLRDLGNPKPKVRLTALADLRRHLMREETPPPELIKALEERLSDEDPECRAKAAEVVGECQVSECAEQVLELVGDPHPLVAQRAVGSLGGLPEAVAPKALEKALKASRPELRFQAVMAWPEAAGKDRLDPLLGASRDEDPLVRHIAVRVMEDCLAPASAHPEMADCFARYKLPAAVEQRARVLLKDEVPGVAVAAALLLAGGGNRDGQRLIVRVVNDELNAQEPDDEAAAVELVGPMGAKKAISGLQSRAYGAARLWKERFSFLAKVSLLQLGAERPRQDFLRDLQAWSIEKRALAVIALGKARSRHGLLALRQLEATPKGLEPSVITQAIARIEARAATPKP